MLQFPLLYSLFLVIDGTILTALFHYLAQFDPPHEMAEYATEEAKRDAEIAAEEAGTRNGEYLKGQGETEGDGVELVMKGGATPGGAVAPPADREEGVDSPTAADEEAPHEASTPSLAPLISQDGACTASGNSTSHPVDDSMGVNAPSSGAGGEAEAVEPIAKVYMSNKEVESAGGQQAMEQAEGEARDSTSIGSIDGKIDGGDFADDVLSKSYTAQEPVAVAKAE